MIKKLLLLTVAITTLLGANITLADLESENIASIKSNSDKPYVRAMYDKPDIDQEVIEFEVLLKKIDSQEPARIKCDEGEKAYYCALYAYYQIIISKDVKQAYDYFIKSYNLGYIEKGVEIANIQMNHPEIFTDGTQPSIDESIEYLEASFNDGSIDAIRLLVSVYALPKYNRIDYEKVEYYLKLGIEQNLIMSRQMLASLYLYDMKDFSKTDESIQLLKEDLRLERNVLSSNVLMTIYIYPNKFGREQNQQNINLGMAYAYITRYLKKEGPNNIHTSKINVINDYIEYMEKGLTPEDKQQIQDLYKEIKAEIDEPQNKQKN